MLLDEALARRTVMGSTMALAVMLRPDQVVNDRPAGTPRLPSMAMAPTTDWNPILRGEFEKPYWTDLMAFVAAERAAGEVYPPAGEVFAALHLTAFTEVKVVILGQDPYHGPRQAHGLCFSVNPGVAVPPSLGNIFKELDADLGISPTASGDLRPWARQGVLLLNTTLTVRAHQPASHQGKGWERFTDEVIRALGNRAEHVVFLLWGAHARKKKALLDRRRHTIIESAHPSPLSAHRGFFGSRPFSAANAALEGAGLGPIDWRLAPS
jgi:uracil-DNA glycosylase